LATDMLASQSRAL